ncbi:hypothetical protein [Streptomyces sp. NPDC058252]|uniref:hypothetical protein n=1 Tax=Streptomyces sp. NPDC058252 TaxID=3346405 RepID=UPI0036E05A12
MLTNYAEVASLAVGLVLPALVALFTRPSTNPTVKAVAHAVLAVATGTTAVYQANPEKAYWAPAVVAAFLAWLSGTAFYHSLLKKYAWFGWLQNALVREAKSLLEIRDPAYLRYLEIAADAEQGDVNNFPLSTDTVQYGVEDVGQFVEPVETVAVPAIATTQTLSGAPETTAV